MKTLLRPFTLLVLIVTLTIPVLAAAEHSQVDQPEKISLSSKVPVSFYGFVLAEFLYADSQLSSFGTLNNDPASYNRTMVGFNRVVDESVEANNDAFLSATVQNTRFGFRLDPYDFDGKSFTVDARLEMDFFSTSELNANSILPRLRRAYAGIGQQSWHVLMGQEWDLFSPLFPATFNIGAVMWRQGNLGFRRPQIRLTLNQALGEKGGVEEAISVNLPGNLMTLNDNGNTTGIPMFQGRLGFWYELPAGKLWAYISGLFARHKNAVAGGADINNWGIAASIQAPLHRYLQPSGEFHYGYSLGSLLSNSSDTKRQRLIAGWGQIKSLWLSWFESNIGYGLETLNGSQVATGFVKRNQVAMVNLKFKPVPALAIGPEYNYLRTTYQGTGSSSANAFFVNMMYSF